MADDPTRTQALRAAGFAAVVDTADPPGKVTVVFELADFDALVAALVKGDPVTVSRARADGLAEGRSDGEATAGQNARRRLARELINAAGEGPGALEAKVLELARSEGVRIGEAPQPPPGVHNAMLGDGPADNRKARIRG